MAAQKPFRVVIVGGSIAGLSLANMLQKAGIDFVVLEAYPDIAPQVGASIGLNGYGLRILDQLDCYDEIRALIEPVDHLFIREGSTGRVLADHAGLADTMQERHGYPLCFLDRQAVLKILFDHIEDKSKVLTSARVISATQTDSGVSVTTGDGSVYHGDVLVGCDGVHSTVRREMWRIADESQPGYFPESAKTAATCTYGCIFGISVAKFEVKPGEIHGTYHEHRSHGVMTGPENRIYWFLFFNTGIEHQTREFPRYSKEDEKAFVEKHASDLVAHSFTIEDLYTSKVSSTMNALPEYVFKKWHHGRIITIGDSAHAYHPVSGHGGNGALESAAALANGLYESLKKSETPLTTAQFSTIFSEVQDSRHARVSELVRRAHLQQRIDAMENPLLRFIALNVIPRAGKDSLQHRFSYAVPAGIALKMAAVPKKPRTVPFHDELLRAPKGRGWVWYFSIILFVSLSVLGILGLGVRSNIDGTSNLLEKGIEAAKQTGVFPDNGLLLKQHWTGITPIDKGLTFLSAVFYPVVSWQDTATSLAALDFLISIFPVLAILTIESHRYTNLWSLFSFTSLWAVLYQTLGIAFIGPLMFIAYVTNSEEPNYWWQIYSYVPINTAKAILPALILGYLLPTLLIFAPVLDSYAKQTTIVIWQFTPFFVNILVPLISHLFPKPSSSSLKARTAHLGPLNAIYITTFLVSGLTHLLILLASPVPLSAIFHVSTSFSPVPSLIFGLQRIFLHDFCIFSIALLVFCLLAVWDLKRVGRVDVSWWKAAVGILASTFVLGPGAVAVAVWWWRERVLARGVDEIRGGKVKSA